MSRSASNSKNSPRAISSVLETSKLYENLSCRRIYVGELGVVGCQTADRVGDVDIISLPSQITTGAGAAYNSLNIKNRLYINSLLLNVLSFGVNFLL